MNEMVLKEGHCGRKPELKEQTKTERKKRGREGAGGERERKRAFSNYPLKAQVRTVVKMKRIE